MVLADTSTTRKTDDSGMRARRDVGLMSVVPSPVDPEPLDVLSYRRVSREGYNRLAAFGAHGIWTGYAHQDLDHPQGTDFLDQRLHVEEISILS